MSLIEHWDARALVLLREARAMIPHADVRAYVRNDWCARADQLIESPPTQGAVVAAIAELEAALGWYASPHRTLTSLADDSGKRARASLERARQDRGQ
jgi:hypothetical protein